MLNSSTTLKHIVPLVQPYWFSMIWQLELHCCVVLGLRSRDYSHLALTSAMWTTDAFTPSERLHKQLNHPHLTQDRELMHSASSRRLEGEVSNVGSTAQRHNSLPCTAKTSRQRLYNQRVG